jgi:hypothetical protein
VNSRKVDIGQRPVQAKVSAVFSKEWKVPTAANNPFGVDAGLQAIAYITKQKHTFCSGYGCYGSATCFLSFLSGHSR